jgi:hypothetical protein
MYCNKNPERTSTSANPESVGSATVFRAVQIHIRCYIRVCYNLSGQVANANDVSGMPPVVAQ